MANPYSVLGIDSSSSEKDIKMAYRRQAMKYHPDRNPGSKEAESKFKEIKEAYETLTTTKKPEPLINTAHNDNEEIRVITTVFNNVAELYDSYKHKKRHIWETIQEAEQQFDKKYTGLTGFFTKMARDKIRQNAKRNLQYYAKYDDNDQKLSEEFSKVRFGVAAYRPGVDLYTLGPKLDDLQRRLTDKNRRIDEAVAVLKGDAKKMGY